MNDLVELAFALWIVILTGAFLTVGLAAVTGSWSRTAAHGAAMRESVRDVRRGKKR